MERICRIILILVCCFGAVTASTVVETQCGSSVSHETIPLRNCRQSSWLHIDHHCRWAFGRFNLRTNYSQTASELSPYWEARTSGQSRICQVTVISDAASRSTISALVDGTRCDLAKDTADGQFALLEFHCNLVGSLVRIENRRSPSVLTVYYASVKGNNSVSKATQPKPEKLRLTSCRQSSDFVDAAGGTGRCSGAIDGVTDPETINTISHTNKDLGAFWETQLDFPALVTSVHITNRQFCCQERLTNFSIKVDGRVCSQYIGESRRAIVVQTCVVNSSGDWQHSCRCRGSVLRIEQNGAEYLHMAEVHVFGLQRLEPKPLPLSKQLFLHSCRQSSEYQARRCNGAIDGNPCQSEYSMKCAIRTQDNWDPWWEAQTVKPSHITHVRIYQYRRPDSGSKKLTDFFITVDDATCAEYKGGYFPLWTFSCNRDGSILSIKSHIRPTYGFDVVYGKTYLSFGEVQAFGFPLDSWS